MGDTDFDDHIKSGALILFWADWCPLCIIMLDIFRELDTEYGDRICIGSVIFDDNPKLQKKYEVYGVPTAIAYKDGEVIDVRPGFRDKEQYADMIECLLRIKKQANRS
jgi:thioredoxin 1